MFTPEDFPDGRFGPAARSNWHERYTSGLQGMPFARGKTRRHIISRTDNPQRISGYSADESLLGGELP